TPRHIKPREVEAALRAIPGVTGAHDLHIWSLTQSRVSLSVHLTLSATQPVQPPPLHAATATATATTEDDGSCDRAGGGTVCCDGDDNHAEGGGGDIGGEGRATTLRDYARVLESAQELLCARYGIHHATIQLDPAGASGSVSVSGGGGPARGARGEEEFLLSMRPPGDGGGGGGGDGADEAAAAAAAAWTAAAADEEARFFHDHCEPSMCRRE
ncbi:hypothetical protein HK405_000046, partial [Cladochytrium tenue]